MNKRRNNKRKKQVKINGGGKERERGREIKEQKKNEEQERGKERILVKVGGVSSMRTSIASRLVTHAKFQ